MNKRTDIQLFQQLFMSTNKITFMNLIWPQGSQYQMYRIICLIHVNMWQLQYDVRYFVPTTTRSVSCS